MSHICLGFYQQLVKSRDRKNVERSAYQPEHASIIFWQDPFPPMNAVATEEMVHGQKHLYNNRTSFNLVAD